MSRDALSSVTKMATSGSIRYRVIEECGRQKFECLLCHRSLFSKRNVLYHLHSSHDMSKYLKLGIYTQNFEDKFPRKERHAPDYQIIATIEIMMSIETGKTIIFYCHYIVRFDAFGMYVELPFSFY